MRIQQLSIALALTAIFANSRVAFGVPLAPSQYVLTYDFEDVVGTGISDGTANHNSIPAGAVYSGVTQGVAGHAGKGISIVNNGNGLAELANFVAAPSSAAVTLEYWVKSSSVTGGSWGCNAPVYLGGRYSNDFSVGWCYNPGNQLNPSASLTTPLGTCGIADYASPSPHPFGGLVTDWHHVSASYDGVNIEVALDGHRWASAACALGPLPANPGLYIVGPGDTSSFTFDELRLSSGRNLPTGCVAGMVDTHAGFCIDPNASSEIRYGDAFNACIGRGAQVCSYAQIYAGVKTAFIEHVPSNYRVSDIMYYQNNFQSYFGAGNGTNLLVPPTVNSGPANPPGPQSGADQYYCCSLPY